MKDVGSYLSYYVVNSGIFINVKALSRNRCKKHDIRYILFFFGERSSIYSIALISIF